MTKTRANPPQKGPRRMPSRELDFLSGGGEMGRRMRAFDWSSTALGDPAGWPRSLRTTVGILLNSRYPMFLAWGRELTFLYNDGYRPIFGEKHPEALGQPFARIWSEIWDDIGPLVERALAGEPTWSENLQLMMERRGFPEETYFTFSYSPVRGDEGEIEGMFCACTETTGEFIGRRRLKTLRDLAAATGGVRSVADVCRVAGEVLVRNPEDVPFSLLYLREADGLTYRLMSCSGCTPGAPFCPEHVEAVEQPAPGWPAEAVLPAAGRLLHDISPHHGLPGTPWPESARTVAILPLGGPAQELGGYLVAGASPRLPFDEQYMQFLDLLAGGLTGALANAQAHENERKRAEALAEIDRAKTLFFSNASHEFRTPLTLILGPLIDALAEEDELPPALREPLSVAHRNSLRLLKLVNSLLDFSRIEAGRMRARYEPVDLAAFTADLASNFRSACERAGLELRVRCPPLPEPVYVDRDMWEKVVLNLVSNAFKFTLDGHIQVSLEPTAEGARLEVQDTGVGIPERELPHLFERFHRVEGARGRSQEGTGIGLALVRELVKLHGGRVEASSVAGSGAAFSVVVPFGSVHLPREHVSTEPAASSTATGAAAFVEEALRWLPDTADHEARLPLPPAVSEAARGRVLVADDNADVRDYLSRLLGQHWEVETASNGRQALHAILREPPDLVLADMMMPEMDGLSLVRALRADPGTAALRLLMVSARAGEEARIEALQAGVDDYLVKPFNARELVARVSAQLTLGHSARERAELLERERAAHRNAELQRQHLESVFMQAPAPVVILRGERFVVELANRHACRVWRRRWEEVIDRPLLEALPELRGQVFETLLRHVYETGETHVGEETHAQLDWEETDGLQDVYFTFVYAPMHDVDGNVDGVLVLAFDVTEQVQARERINELRRQAEAASRAKDEFLAMLGHELRNPLAPIVTALELMRLEGGETFARERELIERQAKQLVSLVDDLMDVSRIAQGKVEIKQERVSLAGVITHAIEMVSPLLEQRQHRLVSSVPEQGLETLGDPMRLAQVFSNLLSNAAKYTDQGGEITITGQLVGNRVEVQVRDNGTGISPELLPRVFDMFAQQPQNIDRALGGLGLGLTIVKSIVELHCGDVSARSEGRGLGSEFTVRLPALDDAAAAGPVNRSCSARRSASERARVLVVDDNDDAAAVLADYVAALGHDVRVARDGPTALRVAGKFAPQVALLDIGLPGMDGYELGDRLRAQQPDAIRLIAVTGYGQPAERQRTGASGFEAHMVKPVDLTRLSDLLAELAAPT